MLVHQGSDPTLSYQAFSTPTERPLFCQDPTNMKGRSLDQMILAICLELRIMLTGDNWCRFKG